MKARFEFNKLPDDNVPRGVECDYDVVEMDYGYCEDDESWLMFLGAVGRLHFGTGAKMVERAIAKWDCENFDWRYIIKNLGDDDIQEIFSALHECDRLPKCNP